MRKPISLIILAACVVLAAAWAPAQDAAEDVIGDLIREIKSARDTESQQDAEVARATLPQSPASAHSRQEAIDPLAKSYENMARCLARAALVKRRDLFTQGRASIEEFLRGCLAQAAYETGRFKSGLSLQACNYWGMKDRGDVGSSYISYKGDKYEKFGSMYEGCLGYIEFISRDRYAGFEAHLDSKRGYIAHIADSGWCPDGDYVDATMGVYDTDKAEIDRAVKIATDELYNPSRTP